MNPDIFDHLLKQALKGSEELLSNLYQDDSFYYSARYSDVLENDARKLVLYGFVREVKKACYVLVQKAELLKDSAPQEDGQETRLINEALEDELQLWVRKLTEVLVKLINFAQANNGLEFRAFISLENLELFVGKQADQKKFFGKENENVQHSIELYKARVIEDYNSINKGVLWFFDESKIDNRTPPLFESFAKMFTNALSYADADEVVTFGATYQSSYSQSSASVHSTASSPHNEINFETVKNSAITILMLCLHILDRANAINGTTGSFSIKDVLAQGSVAPEILAKLRQKFKTGDLVLAHGNLAEVTEKIEGKNGYTSYKVKFLTKPPIPEIPEDYYSSDTLRILLRKDGTREYLEKAVTKAPVVPEAQKILEQDDEFLYESMKSMYVDLEQRGLLIAFLTNPIKQNGITP